MSIEIKKIKEIRTIEGNVQLCHLDKPNPPNKWEVIPREAPIWKEGEKLQPAAFVFGKKAQLEVDIDFTISDKDETGENEYKLIGSYFPTDVFKGTFNIDDINKTVTVTVYDCNPNEAEFFQGIQGNFTWQLVPGNHMQDSEPPPGQKTDKETENSNNDNSHTTNLELYWLSCDPGEKDAELFKIGIPVEILQQVNITYQLNEETQAILSSMDPPPPGVKFEPPDLPPSPMLISIVVTACFYRNPPGYCISYSTNYFTNNSYNGISLKLKEYLLSLNNPDQNCSCIDMAAVLQFYLKALGISDVKFSVLGSFGYLKVTDLIGRGFSNNPFYGEIQSDKVFGEKGVPVVIQESQWRTNFGTHAFCILPDKGLSPDPGDTDPCKNCCHNMFDGNGDKKPCENGDTETRKCKVADSCVGPHTGYETMSQYVNNSVDDIHKANGGEAKVKNIKCYRGVVECNFNIPLETKPDFPLIAEFEKIVSYKPGDKKILEGNFVVRSWPDPRKSRVLRRKDWHLFYEDIIPGSGEVLKSWTLVKKRESIHIDLYVSSGNNMYSFHRFLSIGSLTSEAKLPFEACPLHPGHFSAMHESIDCVRYLWVYYNVVFDVTFTNVTLKPGKLVRWFNRIAGCRLKIKKFSQRNLRKYLPSTDGIQLYVNNVAAKDDKKKIPVKINDTITVKLKARENLLYDFTYETGDGLRLIRKTTEEMEFRVIKELKKENKLAVVVVDNKTLLCSSKVFRFYS
ncbi:MAG: hypothetical protein JSV88_27210 [Candidatus Aminicenantes bacterium]|nr:MAG: hypothetical protein JSV88_27210 [Candidatus Aminicenantes bacterium]